MAQLVALESLDLSSNRLGGRIPSQLTKLTFLEVLNFSNNKLEGPIPHGNQFNTFDNDSYSGNFGLCGFPLTKQCGSGEGLNPPAPKLKEDEEWLKEIGSGISQDGFAGSKEHETSTSAKMHSGIRAESEGRCTLASVRFGSKPKFREDMNQG
ncbi:hypothetical protein V6N11_042312 [Hibiscus sabdariffa]|uniref:Uncharacterized protein n=1 Tax=Hibiscus sabdariffa TaxID=183260 RepID=A0ABR2QVZ4_9ROSI